MEQITRRRLLSLVRGAGLTTLLSPELACADGLSPNTVELFVVGPLRLGEWLKRDCGEQWASRHGFELKDAVNALNSAPLYIIDLRDISDPKQPRFAVAREYPALVVARRGTHNWLKDGDTFKLSIEEMSVGVDSTTGQPPIRRVTATVKLELRAALQLEPKLNKGLVVDTETRAFSEGVSYDVRGELLVDNGHNSTYPRDN